MTNIERQTMDVDIVCVGFGPGTAGFLTTLSRALMKEDGTPLVESKVMPGMPPQIICYERADDIGFGVSGVATSARAIRETFPELNPSEIPMTVPVTSEKVLYLLDPVGASRRSFSLRMADRTIRASKWALSVEREALSLPHIPSFLRKDGGLLTTIGQLNQWAGTQLMGSGLVQLWPGTPVVEPLIEDDRVVGVRLADQGTTKDGKPDAGYMPGMDIKAALTVVADGPVGPVGRQLDEHFGLPEGHHQREWAVGMKMLIGLPDQCDLEPGTVLHTFGYPEPEIFGFLYVFPDRVASAGIFIPSWFESPVRTAYRYLQRWLQHPHLWRHLKGGTMRSFGAKSLHESGRRGEPHLVGEGYARIGAGSGSTNVLTGSGVDEAWKTGSLLADGVIELLKADKAFTKENLTDAYVTKRRESWLESDARAAEKARDGFGRGIVQGLIGMQLTGISGGKLSIPAKSSPPHEKVKTVEEYFRGRISPDEIKKIREDCKAKGLPLHDALMERAGWPPIELDGKLLVSHQDALLIGGKVQAPPGYADHVVFLHPAVCEECGEKICVEMCSGEAITNSPERGVPDFDREKCIHCGACNWNCSKPDPDDREWGTIRFNAGAGGLHSAEN